MTKSQVVLISAIRDLMDLLVIGQIPGLNWILNAPVIYLHFCYAGPRALFTLVENIPGIVSESRFDRRVCTCQSQ